mgnify:CR=1 FL=1
MYLQSHTIIIVSSRNASELDRYDLPLYRVIDNRAVTMTISKSTDSLSRLDRTIDNEIQIFCYSRRREKFTIAETVPKVSTAIMFPACISTVFSVIAIMTHQVSKKRKVSF